MKIDLTPLYDLHDHVSPVRELGIHKGGKLFFSRSDDMLLIYDLEKGVKLQGFYDSEGYSAAAFSPDGRNLIFDSDSMIHHFDIRCWQEKMVVSGEMWEHRNSDGCMDSGLRAIGDEQGVIKVYKLGAVEDGEPEFVLEGHKGYIEYVAFAPNGRILASGSGDHTIRFWDMDNRTEVSVKEVHDDAVTSLAFNPEGTIMISGDYRGNVKIWNVKMS
jgi:WD40 repeat protein